MYKQLCERYFKLAQFQIQVPEHGLVRQVWSPVGIKALTSLSRDQVSHLLKGNPFFTLQGNKLVYTP